MPQQIELPGLEVQTYHDFKERLVFAQNNTKLQQLEVFYRACFPDIAEIIKVQDETLQKQGIDTILVLTNGKRIQVDEKIRAKDWGDILLEEYSVWPFSTWDRFGEFKLDGAMLLEPQWGNLEAILIGNKESVPCEYQQFLTPGWITGDKLTDYIAYVIKPSRKVYFLPFLLLQRAWAKYYLDWLNEYSRCFAPNRTYLTANIPIPTEVLYRALFEEAHY